MFFQFLPQFINWYNHWKRVNSPENKFNKLNTPYYKRRSTHFSHFYKFVKFKT